MAIPVTDQITSVIKFMGATVESFDLNLGFNASPTTLSVNLVVDTEDGDTFVMGGAPGLNNNPGAYFPFTTPDGVVTFGGFVQNVKKSHSMSGTRYTATLADPRMLFKNIPIITDLNTQGSAANNNIIDLLGRFNNDSIIAHWNEDGILWSSFVTALSTWFGFFYGKLVQVVFHTSVLGRIPQNYRIPMQNATLDAVLTQIAKDNALDIYASSTLLPFQGGGPTTPVAATELVRVVIHGVYRGSTSFSNNDFETFLNAPERSGRVVNYSLGTELRTDPNSIQMWGAKKKLTYTNSGAGGGANPRALFNRFADGNWTDRPFVSLEHIDSDDPALIQALPSWNFDARVLTANAGLISPVLVRPPTFRNQRITVARKGYWANEEILRAALYSKAAWAAVVWDTYNSPIKRERLLKGISNRDVYDSANPIGAHNVPAGTVWEHVNNPAALDGVANALGIYTVPFDYENPVNNAYGAGINLQDLNSLTRVLLEAVYQATVKMAEEHYGKTFVTQLPYSTTIQNLISRGSIYELYHRKYTPEYSVTDASWVEDPYLPYPIKFNTNGSFITEEGRLKAFMRIDVDGLKQYNFDNVAFWAPNQGNDPTTPTNPPFLGGWDQQCLSIPTYINFDNQNKDSIFKITKDTALASTVQSLHPDNYPPQSNYWLYNSDITVNQHEYDPRFATITLGNPIELFSGLIRGVCIDQGVKSLCLCVATNQWQEFVSYIYSDWFIVPDDDPIFDNPGVYPIYIAPNGDKYIAISLYYDAMHETRFSGETIFAFGRRRYTESFHYFIPLEWNFLRYGPFTQIVLNAGGISVSMQDNLAPWTYQSINNMNEAGFRLAAAATAASTLVTTADMTIAGMPEFNIGSPLGINSNLSNISLRYGVNGVTTTYQYRTFSEISKFQGKVDFDKRANILTNFTSVNKEILKLEERFRSEWWDEYGRETNPSFTGNVHGTLPRWQRETPIPVDGIIFSAPGRFGAKGKMADGTELYNTSTDSTKDYRQTHSSSISDIMQPFSTSSPGVVQNSISNHGTAARMMSWATAHNPFSESSAYSSPIPYGNLPPENWRGGYNPDDLRPVGFKTPSVFVGWGYDTEGFPIPNVSGNFHLEQNFWGETRHPEHFFGGATHGSAVPPSAYIAGPLELQFDRTRGTWVATTDRPFFAVIQGHAKKEDPFTSPYYRKGYYSYSWVRLKLKEEFGSSPNNFNTLPLRPDLITGDESDVPRSTAESGVVGGYKEAFNLYELSQREPTSLDSEPFSPIPFLPAPVPSGTVVLMTKYQAQVALNEDLGPSVAYIFNNEEGKVFHAKITSSDSIGDNQWGYGFEQVEFDTSDETWKETGWGSFQNNPTARNLLEFGNTPTEIHPGALVGSVPAGGDVTVNVTAQPISNGTIVRMWPSPIAEDSNTDESRYRFLFSVNNAVIVSCSQ